MVSKWHAVQITQWIVTSSTHSEEHVFDEDKFMDACECLADLRGKYPQGTFVLLAEINA